ncbi:MAG: DUF348 domain-containing protein, partial [Chloroflexi bacterium]|nr:DUF348 domain-containing protein [Chloroflexota bacterium]
MKHSSPNLLQRWLSRGAVTGGIMAAMIGVMAFGYASTLTPISIVVDGQERSIRTNQREVETILREAGISIEPADIVGPELRDELAPEQSTIIVQHARPVTIIADGNTYRLKSQATALIDLLVEAKVKLGPDDLAIANNQPIDRTTNQTYRFARNPGDVAPLSIVLRRARPITLDLGNGDVRQIQSPASTVGQALEEAGVELHLADRITPDLNTALTPGLKIEVEQSRLIHVDVDGRTLHTRTLRQSIGEVLADLGVTLIGQDYTQPPLDAAVAANTSVKIVRVREEILIEQETIPFDTVTIADPEMELDTNLEQAGRSGVSQKRTMIRYENGQEVQRVADPDFVVLQAPQNKELRYGTNVVIRTLDTPSGPIEYWRKIRA